MVSLRTVEGSCRFDIEVVIVSLMVLIGAVIVIVMLRLMMKGLRLKRQFAI